MHQAELKTEIPTSRSNSPHERFNNKTQRRIDVAHKRSWDPFTIDLSKDIGQFSTLNLDQQRVLKRFLIQNLYGEDAVEKELESILNYFKYQYGPDSSFAKFISSIWIPEEASHAAFSKRYLEEVCGVDTRDIDLSGAPKYQRIFDQVLRGAMAKLDTKKRVEHALEAVSIYTAFVENTVAVPAFTALFKALDEIPTYNEQTVLPGLRKGIGHFKADEAHHVGFGKDFLSFCDRQYGRVFVFIHAVKPVIKNMPLAISMLNEFFNREKPFPFKLSKHEVIADAFRNIKSSFNVLSKRNNAQSIDLQLEEESFPAKE
jgi:ribonucleotide reductase beta subunit family protein with ferritin-like domain